MRVLLADYPRERWGEPTLAEMARLLQAAIAFHTDIQTDAPGAADNASRLADVLGSMGPRVLRHLHDEEEIVIPLIATRANEIG
jgi:hypothetical protein